MAGAEFVKITPLGSRTGDLCAWDTALLFEDPTGVTILFEPGFTVAGEQDPRLGAVDAILVSHHHSDHIGGRKLSQDPNAPSADCHDNDLYQTVTLNTTTAEIAAAKNSAVIVGRGMGRFLAGKIGTIRQVATPECPIEGPDNQIVVPRSSPCTTASLSFGAQHVVAHAGSSGVRIAVVHALHSDELLPRWLTSSLSTPLLENSLRAYGGLAIGYVLTFTNGLKVYLSGDTGPTSDMQTIVRGLYEANLAVVPIAGTGQMGPSEAAFAVRELVRPSAVIPWHTHEASTTGGTVNPGTRLARFIDLIDGKVPVHVPLSGGTMEFDGGANCVAGCSSKHRGR